MENTSQNTGKKFLIPLIVIVLVAIVGFFIYTSSHKGAVSGSETKASVTATPLEKTLHIQSAGETNQSEVTAQKVAVQGDTLTTDSTGRALLENSNGTKTILDYNSSLTVAKADTDSTHVSNYLNNGRMWAQVKKVLGQGEFYEIETQNAVAVVRGTVFGVRFDSPDTTLRVQEGTVTLVPVDPTTRVRHYDKEVLVGAGMKGVIGVDGKIVETPMTDEEKQDPFFAYGLTIANRPKVQSSGQGGTQSQGTLRELLSKGQDMTCTYSASQSGSTNTGVMYISGNNMRGDFTIQNGSSGTMEAHMIRTGTYVYSWSGEQGTKVSVDVSTANTPNPTGSSGSFVDLDGSYNYKCNAWQKDASKFIPPSNVTFMDIGAMMKTYGR